LLTYASYFFPLLPQHLGGGRLEKIDYIVKGEKVSGLKVHETSELVFLQSKDKKIKKLKWEDIEEILPRPESENQFLPGSQLNPESPASLTLPSSGSP
jgi:hypothetical protein